MAMSLQAVIDSFLAWAHGKLAPGTCDQYNRQFKRFVAYAGDVDADTLKPAHLLLWGKTWHQIQAIQRLFNWAADTAELVARNPFKKVKLPAVGQRKRTLKRDQILSLLRKSRRPFRDFVIGLRESMARPQEVRSFEWEQLHGPDGVSPSAEQLAAGVCFFVLEKYKARERRANPNTPRLILVTARFGRLLNRLRARPGYFTGIIFLNHQHRPWTGNALRIQMKKARGRVGLEPDRSGERVVCYTLRHTIATLAAANGVRDRILADLMGHSSTRTTARYQHLDIEHLVAAMRRIHFRA